MNLKILIALYVTATGIFIIAMWSWACPTSGPLPDRMEVDRRKARAARFTLVFPLWLPILCLELFAHIVKLALLKRKKPKLATELCPECQKKIIRGPHR